MSDCAVLAAVASPLAAMRSSEGEPPFHRRAPCQRGAPTTITAAIAHTRAVRAVALLVLAGVFGGCEEGRTEVVLVVDTDLVVPLEVDAINLRISNGSGEEVANLSEDFAVMRPAFPLTLGLEPRGDSLGPITVTVEATRTFRIVATRTVRFRFERGQRRMVRVLLSRLCLGTTCEAGTSCLEGTCVPIDVVPSQWRGVPPAVGMPDAGVGCLLEACNGADDDCDGMIDEDFDLGADPYHCGACGAACLAPDVLLPECRAGTCVAVVCETNTEDCDGLWDNGCEQSLLADDNCGSCGHTCERGCSGGLCVEDLIRNIAVGANHTCALMEDGAVRCWGDDDRGQLGDGAGSGGMVTGMPMSAVALASGSEHTCAIQTGGELFCWGRNDAAQLGTPMPTANQTSALRVMGLSDQIRVDGGVAFTCVADRFQEVTCWGANDVGQLGGRTMSPGDRTMPMLPAAAIDDLALGDAHGCALLAGEVWCWGNNSAGQLGDGTRGSFRTVPGAVPGVDALEIAGGGAHTCARLADGTVQCWGRNSLGQLGDGLTADRAMPAPVMGLSGVSAIAAGATHTCAVASGQVYCWGSNDAGQIGDGMSGGSRPMPTMVPLRGVVQLAAGEAHTCALTITRHLYCWGSNDQEQISPTAAARVLSPLDITPR